MVSFGVETGNGLPLQTTIQLAKVAEEIGIDYFWIADCNPSPPHRDIWVAVSAALHSTKRIKVATGINTPYTRHPALLAVAMNSFNELFPGRAHLGLGPGGYLPLYPLNIPIWNKPIRAVREAFEIVYGLLDGKTLDYHGEIFQALDLKLDPKPTQPWETWLACRGPQMIKLAGRFATGTLMTAPVSFLDTVKQHLHKGAIQGGRTLNDVIIGNIVPSAISDDYDRVFETLRKHLSLLVGYTPDIMHKLAGIPLDDARKVRHLLNSQGTEAASTAVTPKMIDVYSIHGESNEFINQMQAHIDAGVEHFCFGSPLHPEDPVEGLKLIGKAVLPHFK